MMTTLQEHVHQCAHLFSRTATTLIPISFEKRNVHDKSSVHCEVLASWEQSQKHELGTSSYLDQLPTSQDAVGVSWQRRAP
jgi:hypothetical protein